MLIRDLYPLTYGKMDFKLFLCLKRVSYGALAMILRFTYGMIDGCLITDHPKFNLLYLLFLVYFGF